MTWHTNTEGLISFIHLLLAGSQGVACAVRSWQRPVAPLAQVANAPPRGDDLPFCSYKSRELTGVCRERRCTLREKVRRSFHSWIRSGTWDRSPSTAAGPTGSRQT